MTTKDGQIALQNGTSLLQRNQQQRREVEGVD